MEKGELKMGSKWAALNFCLCPLLLSMNFANTFLSPLFSLSITRL